MVSYVRLSWVRLVKCGIQKAAICHALKIPISFVMRGGRWGMHQSYLGGVAVSEESWRGSKVWYSKACTSIGIAVWSCCLGSLLVLLWVMASVYVRIRWSGNHVWNPGTCLSVFLITILLCCLASLLVLLWVVASVCVLASDGTAVTCGILKLFFLSNLFFSKYESESWRERQLCILPCVSSTAFENLWRDINAFQNTHPEVGGNGSRVSLYSVCQVRE